MPKWMNLTHFRNSELANEAISANLGDTIEQNMSKML